MVAPSIDTMLTRSQMTRLSVTLEHKGEANKPKFSYLAKGGPKSWHKAIEDSQHQEAEETENAEEKGSSARGKRKSR